MRIPYIPVPAKKPIPARGGTTIRYRPVAAVRLAGPAQTRLHDGLLDTGADDTAAQIGWGTANRNDVHHASFASQAR